MADRARLQDVVDEAQQDRVGAYFLKQKDVEFFHSGCAILDCVLGGGWAEGRIINIVGDSGVAKTGLAMEACSNFLRKYPQASVYYNETEAAFDMQYAHALGMPTDRVTFISECYTVEELFSDMEARLEEQQKSSTPALYVVDSLDALSDEAEQSRKIDDGTYGAAKAKKLSELFRRLNARLAKANFTVIIVSQVRDNIGVSFGEKHKRSGGKALQFYCSQVLWLANIGKEEKVIRGVKRPVAIKVRAKCKKNKVGLPFRECDFEYVFGYGIHDVKSDLAWLISVGKLVDFLEDGEKTAKKLLRTVDKLSYDEFLVWRDNISQQVKQAWEEIETEFLPVRRKY